MTSKGGAGVAPGEIDRDAALSPAARAIIDGAWFGETSDVEEVEGRCRIGPDPLDDVLTIRRYGDETDAHLETVTRVTLGELETLIESGRIGFIMGPPALDYNRARGWRARGLRRDLA